MDTKQIVLGAVVRHALSAVFAILFAHGVLTKGEVTDAQIAELSIAIAGWMMTTGWAVVKELLHKWHFLEALDVAPGPNAASTVAEYSSKLTTVDKLREIVQ